MEIPVEDQRSFSERKATLSHYVSTKEIYMKHFRKPAVTGFLAVGILALFAGSLKADPLAYLLGGQGGPTQAFGTVDLNTGAFTSLGTILQEL